jgi:hypothetical protein
VVEMLVDLVDLMAACSRAVDREVTRCLAGDQAARRRIAATALAVLIASHLRPEIVRYRSTLVEAGRPVDRELVEAGRR